MENAATAPPPKRHKRQQQRRPSLLSPPGTPLANPRAPPFGSCVTFGIIAAAALSAALAWAGTFTEFVNGDYLFASNTTSSMSYSLFEMKMCVALGVASSSAQVSQCATLSLADLVRQRTECKSYVTAIRSTLAFCLIGAICDSLLAVLAVVSLKLRGIRHYFIVLASAATAALLVSWPLTVALYTELSCKGDLSLRDDPFFTGSIGPSAYLQAAAFFVSMIVVLLLCAVWMGSGPFGIASVGQRDADGRRVHNSAVGVAAASVIHGDDDHHDQDQQQQLEHQHHRCRLQHMPWPQHQFANGFSDLAQAAMNAPDESLRQQQQQPLPAPHADRRRSSSAGSARPAESPPPSVTSASRSPVVPQQHQLRQPPAPATSVWVVPLTPELEAIAPACRVDVRGGHGDIDALKHALRADGLLDGIFVSPALLHITRFDPSRGAWQEPFARMTTPLAPDTTEETPYGFIIPPAA